jgi:hypothetical protein
VLLQLEIYAQPGLGTAVERNRVFHEKITKGVKIFPGQWRPNFGSEQIVWISPPWSSQRPEYGQEFLYLDFPEAIKIGKTIVYLSHVHPRFPAVYNYNLDPVHWWHGKNSLSYERKLPNGLRFDGNVSVKDSALIELTIGITNHTGRDLDSIFLQTCAFLNAIGEFDSPVDSNKLVYMKDRGWASLSEARTVDEPSGKYYVGWLGGTKSVELPFIVLKSEVPDRYVVFSWLTHSYSFVGNANHPCFHSDPRFPDVPDKQRREIKGILWFYQGDLDALENDLRSRFMSRSAAEK